MIVACCNTVTCTIVIVIIVAMRGLSVDNNYWHYISSLVVSNLSCQQHEIRLLNRLTIDQMKLK